MHQEVHQEDSDHQEEYNQIEKQMMTSTQSLPKVIQNLHKSTMHIDADTQTEQQQNKKQIEVQCQGDPSKHFNFRISQNQMKSLNNTQIDHLYQPNVEKGKPLTQANPFRSKLRYANLTQKRQSNSRDLSSFDPTVTSQKHQQMKNQQVENRNLITAQGNRVYYFHKNKSEAKLQNWMIIKQLFTHSHSSQTKLILQINSLQKEAKNLVSFFKDNIGLQVQLQQWQFLTQQQIQFFITNRIKLFPQKISQKLSLDSTLQQLKSFFISYHLLTQQFSKQQIKNKQLTVKKYKNCVYFGQMVDNKKEGLGILVYYNGKCYQGGFKNDFKQGEGLQYQQDGFYVGSFLNGFKHGIGLQYSAQSLYLGTFVKNIKQSIGFYVNSSMRYLGEWQNNQPCGFCLQNDIKQNQHDKYLNEIFIGTKRKGIIKGISLQKFQNNDLYVGNYDGEPQGYGQYYWSNGAVYRGDFMNGLRHGKGQWIKSGGDTYIGQYKNDKKCGYGIYRWTNQIEYNGHFENDLRHGFGQMIFPNGKTYKGHWVNGIQDKSNSKDIGKSKKSH